MAKRLFVGGLPYSYTSQQLQDLFAQFGSVTSCTIISDKFSGRSKGFGFIEFDQDEAADKAIESLNGSELEGRKIVVNVARPMEERAPRQYGDDNRSGGFHRGGGYQDRGRSSNRRGSGRGGY